MLVEAGDVVREGQVLAVLRVEDLSFARAAATAQLAQVSARLGEAAEPATAPAVLAARTSLDVAVDTVRRAEALAARGSVSAQDLLRARASEAAARSSLDAALAEARAQFAQVREAAVAVSQTRTAEREATLRAPFDGVVAARLASMGDVVLAGGAVVRVVDPSRLRVRFEVAAHEAPLVVHDARVTIEPGDSSQPRGPLLGRVSRLAPAFDGATQLRGVEVDLEAGAPLLPGQHVRVLTETPLAEDLFRIPAAAAQHKAGGCRVLVAIGGALEERFVEVVRSSPEGVLIAKAGVSAAERVVVDPASLADGQKVLP
jgi:RND family efflux transporter MFP subunit